MNRVSPIWPGSLALLPRRPSRCAHRCADIFCARASGVRCGVRGGVRLALGSGVCFPPPFVVFDRVADRGASPLLLLCPLRATHMRRGSRGGGRARHQLTARCVMRDARVFCVCAAAEQLLQNDEAGRASEGTVSLQYGVRHTAHASPHALGSVCPPYAVLTVTKLHDAPLSLRASLCASTISPPLAHPPHPPPPPPPPSRRDLTFHRRHHHHDAT